MEQTEKDVGHGGQAGVRKIRGLVFHAPHIGPSSTPQIWAAGLSLAGNQRPTDPGQSHRDICMLVLPGERTVVTPTPGEKPLLSLSQPTSAHCLQAPPLKDCKLTNHIFWENFGIILSKRCLY